MVKTSSCYVRASIKTEQNVANNKIILFNPCSIISVLRVRWGGCTPVPLSDASALTSAAVKQSMKTLTFYS